jgi:hypothetical protein
MSFALIIAGAVLLISAVRNTQGTLFKLVQQDFTGPNNFIYWMVSILIVGSIGYIPKLKPFSVAFLTLIILALVLQRGQAGFFSKFTSQLATTQKTQPTGSNPTATNTTSAFGSILNLLTH